jgi:hypothetical protein
MDNLGKNWQLINILFCGYQRRLEIGDPLNVPKPILARSTVPQRVITSTFTRVQIQVI